MNDINVEKILNKMKQQSDETDRLAKPYVDILINSLGLSNEFAKSIVYDGLIHCDNQSLMSITDFLQSTKSFLILFGTPDKLCKFLNSQLIVDQMYDCYIRKKTIFHYSPEIIANRIDNLMKILCISKNECIDDIITHPDWLYHTEDFMANRFKELTEFWDSSISKTRELCNGYKFFFGTKLEKLQNRLECLSEYFKYPLSSLKKFMLEYPNLITQSVSFFVDNKLTKEIFDKPWLLDCLNGYRNCTYGGYRTFENLLLVVTYIENKFGEIKKFIKRKYKKEVFLGVITQKNNEYYLVSLGANYITEHARKNAPDISNEEKLLESIFGSVANPKPHQEFHHHKELFVKIKSDSSVEIDNIILFMIAIAIKKAELMIQIKSNSKEFTSLMSANLIINDSYNPHESLKMDENNLKVDFCLLYFDESGTITLLDPKMYLDDNKMPTNALLEAIFKGMDSQKDE